MDNKRRKKLKDLNKRIGICFHLPNLAKVATTALRASEL
jgi:hypothetical protein